MVKTTGPAIGQAASGTLGGELTFSSWKGKSYLKKKSTPAQPRTKKQISMRAAMSFLSSQWPALWPSYRLTWIELAKKTNVSPINAYQAYNLERWRNFKFPSMAYPATEDGLSPWPEERLVEGGVRLVKFTISLATYRDHWGIHILGNHWDEFTPNWDYCVHVIPIKTTGTFTWTHRPLAPGDWWYRFASSNKYGKAPLISGWYKPNVTDR